MQRTEHAGRPAPENPCLENPVPRSQRRPGSLPVCLLVILLSACQATTRGPATDASRQPHASCDALFHTMDRLVRESGATRSFPHRIDDFPYLRSTRVLASFRNGVDSDARMSAWLDHLAAADRQARRSELAHLPAKAHRQLTRLATETTLPSGLVSAAEPETTVNACRALLIDRDRENEARLQQLRDVVAPADEYSLVQRVAGLYPLASLGVRAGVARWHDEVRQTYAESGRAASPIGELRRYGAALSPDDRDRTPLKRDALDIPRPDAPQLAALYRAHAPVWEIDTVSDADIPGSPVWERGGNEPGVSTEEPVVYRYSSVTRFRGRPRLQLNYLVWFDARPASGPLDMLAGRLDGVIWRVTLGDDGAPLVYDSVHACGCYHLLFPVGDVALRPEALRLPEPPLVPTALDAPPPGTRVHLRLGAGAHYLEGVSHAVPGPGTARYRFAWREALYTTPVIDGGQRSLFRRDGLVEGTGRGERWFLWPTGVRSPGAMRERGRRATAFIGRRHFDDAFLFDKLFY